MKYVISGLAVAAGVFVVLGAWDASFTGYAFELGTIVLVLGIGFGIAGNDSAGALIGMGILLLLEQPLVNEFRSELQVISAILLAALVLWAIYKVRKKRPTNRPRPPE